MNSAKKHLTPTALPDDGEADGIARWVARCQAGDRHAQQKLFEHFSPAIYRLMVRMAGLQEADDLTQQTFFQALTKIDQFAGKSQFAKWLHRIAVNTALQYRRKSAKHRATTALEGDPVDVRSDNRNRLDDQELLAAALDQVDADLRTVFVLREVEELAYREIAEVLEISEGTVASRLNRARRDIKDRLLSLGWQP